MPRLAGREGVSGRGAGWALAFLLVVAGPAFGQEAAAEAQVSGETTFDVGSAYVWRGLRLSRGPVAQWVVTGEYRDVAASLWWNYDPNEYPSGSGCRRQITEADITLSWGRDAGPGTLTGGFIYYSLRAARDTSELFAGYEFDAVLRPSATLYVDPDEGKGAFLVAGLGRSVELPRGVQLDLEIEAGFNLGNKAMGTTADGRRWSGPYHSEMSVSAEIPLSPALAVTSTFGVSFPIGGRAADAIAAASYDRTATRFVFASLGLTATFGQEP